MQTFVTILAALALFTYGTRMAGRAARRYAGTTLRTVATPCSFGVWGAALAGLALSVILQSSICSAVLVIGLVGAGLVSLAPAVAMMLGANIGITFTSQLVAFHINVLAWPLLALGVGLQIFGLHRKARDGGQILIGAGLVLLSMEIMQRALALLPGSSAAFDLLREPLLGFVAGGLTSAALHSGVAVVGLLQSLAQENLLSISQMLPLLYGANIGPTIAVLLAGASAGVLGRRAALAHLFSGVAGLALFSLLWPVLRPVVLLTGDPLRQVANAHTLFNLITALALLPTLSGVMWLLGRVVPQRNEAEEPHRLNKHLIDVPVIALEVAAAETVRMAGIVRVALEQATAGFMEQSKTAVQAALAAEENINELERELRQYLTEIGRHSLSDEQHRLLRLTETATGCIEKIGDHAENIAELAEQRIRLQVPFSAAASNEISAISGSVLRILDTATTALEKKNDSAARQVFRQESQLDRMEEDMRSGHIDRLIQGACQPRAAILFLDLLGNYERIGDQAAKMADAVTRA